MPKIVIVDDDRGTRSLVRLTLSDGTECFEATTIFEGLELLQRIEPDLLILDLLLPDLDGLSFYYRARELAYNGPVLILTAASPGEELLVRAADELGPDSILLKPFDPDVLAERVNDLLSRKNF